MPLFVFSSHPTCEDWKQLLEVRQRIFLPTPAPPIRRTVIGEVSPTSTRSTPSTLAMDPTTRSTRSPRLRDRHPAGLRGARVERLDLSAFGPHEVRLDVGQAVALAHSLGTSVHLEV